MKKTDKCARIIISFPVDCQLAVTIAIGLGSDIRDSLSESLLLFPQRSMVEEFL